MNLFNCSRRFFLKQNLLTGFGVFLGSKLCSSTYLETQRSLGGLSLSVFDLDATPPLGTELAYGTAVSTSDLGLRAKGIIIHGAGHPIVLCAIDWIGIGDEGYDVFCSTIAKAANTVSERVALHTLHQHDSYRCDFGAEKILITSGIDPKSYDGGFAREFLPRLEDAIKKSVTRKTNITHVGFGKAAVSKVASTRRIMGPDGRVRATRYSSCASEKLREEPEGLIDPFVSLISFWNEYTPLSVLSYYAVHPQSYYRTGIPNPDFPGIARFLRQLAIPDALHIHFTGAAGDIGAGKYNDGSKENRWILAERLAEGIKKAWENTTREKISPKQVSWRSEKYVFTPAPYLHELKKELDENPLLYEKSPGNARKMAWYNRCLSGKGVLFSCLSLGKVRILHLPAESVVEYQLFAKNERPDLFIAVAAYGEYGPGYICTEKQYLEGGYEASEVASNVHPETERDLKPLISKLLE